MKIYLVENENAEYDSTESVIVRAANPEEALAVAATHTRWYSHPRRDDHKFVVREIPVDGPAAVEHAHTLRG